MVKEILDDEELGEDVASDIYEDTYDMYDCCPICGVDWLIHDEDEDGKPVCDEGMIIEQERPRFYTMDVTNYNEEFLIEIILWQDRKIAHLEKLLESDKNG